MNWSFPSNDRESGATEQTAKRKEFEQKQTKLTKREWNLSQMRGLLSRASER
jgi:hypothetical protein